MDKYIIVIMLFSPYRKKSYGTLVYQSFMLKLLLLKCYGEHYFIEDPIIALRN